MSPCWARGPASASAPWYGPGRAGPRVPSEGGHAEIGAPVGRWALAHEIIRVHVGRVSGEHVLSGPGLERIDAALRELDGEGRAPAGREIGRPRHRRLGSRSRVEAVKLFFDYLARFSGDVALMFAAKGGLYLYGGVVQKLSALIEPERFRTAFEAKSPLEPFLEQIPIRLDHQPGAWTDRLRRGRRLLVDLGVSAGAAGPAAGRRRMRRTTKMAMATCSPPL